jgi:hypothetical protein
VPAPFANSELGLAHELGDLLRGVPFPNLLPLDQHEQHGFDPLQSFLNAHDLPAGKNSRCGARTGFVSFGVKGRAYSGVGSVAPFYARSCMKKRLVPSHREKNHSDVSPMHSIAGKPLKLHRTNLRLLTARAKKVSGSIRTAVPAALIAIMDLDRIRPMQRHRDRDLYKRRDCGRRCTVGQIKRSGREGGDPAGACQAGRPFAGRLRVAYPPAQYCQHAGRAGKP